MGYRLECSLKGKENKQWCGGKLFGYAFDWVYEDNFEEICNTFPSFKYLFDKHYLDIGILPLGFGYDSEIKFEMKANDFNEWITKYYIKDFNNFWKLHTKWKISLDKVFLEEDTPVIVEWY